jgi:hypothetical protein
MFPGNMTIYPICVELMLMKNEVTNWFVVGEQGPARAARLGKTLRNASDLSSLQSFYPPVQKSVTRNYVKLREVTFNGASTSTFQRSASCSNQTKSDLIKPN